MARAPTRTSHHVVKLASANPAKAAIRKEIAAAAFTAPGLARPLAVNLIGPIRESSVPRIPSE